MNENPHYKFKRQKNYKIVDKVHKNSNESILAEPMFTHLPNINQLSNEASTNQSTNQKSANTVDIPINQSAVIKDNENKKINKFSIQTNKSSDAKENKQNPDFISKPNKTEPESSTLTRPKTDVSDRNKSKQLASNDIETLLGSSESQGVLKDLASNSSQLLMSTAGGETAKTKKSILKQPGVLPAVVPQKSIVFAEENGHAMKATPEEKELAEQKLAAMSAKKTKTATHRRVEPLKQQEHDQRLSSIEIMMGTVKPTADDHESEDSVTSFNPADTLVTNEAMINDFKDLEEQSFELINPFNDDFNQSKIIKLFK